MAVVIKRLNDYTPSPMMKDVVQEELASMKQGIVTILRSDRETQTKSSSSIRRTLSADMSSKNWLAQNGFLTQAANRDGDERSNGSNPGQDEVWRSIQSQKEIKDQPEPTRDLVLTNQKASGDDKKPCLIPLPPLTKRSSSTLSLEICTESLGSETGSDALLLSNPPCSEASCDADDDQERQSPQTREEEFKDSIFYEKLHVAKYKRAPVRPIPPPIHSISDGDSLYMQPRRENGRLVLEAVSGPPRNYFNARRGDGRLVLTLIHSKAIDRVDELFDAETNEKDAVEEEEGNKYEGVERELGSFLAPNRIIGVHKSSLVMKTFISPGKRNPSWTGNKAAKVTEDQEMVRLQISQSLPPRVSRMIPKPQPPSSFNAYDYFWRNKTTMTSKGGSINPVIANNTKNIRLKNDDNDNIYVAKEYANQDVVVTMKRGGEVESFVPYLKGCKEPKRSILIWEPHCIATS